MPSDLKQLLSAVLERRQLGRLEGDSLILRSPPLTLPLSAALADLKGVPEGELAEAVERVADDLEQLDSQRPFRFKHVSVDPGLDDAFDRHVFPEQLDIAPGLRFMLRPQETAWWKRELGTEPQSADQASSLAARWMLERTGYRHLNGVHEFSGTHALSVVFALGKELGGEPVLVVLNPRKVWLTGDRDEAGLALVYSLAMEELSRRARRGAPLIAGELYRRHGPGDLRRWIPPVGHPLREDFISFRRLALRLTYRHHHLLLGSTGLPLPLAELQGEGDEPLRASCSAFPCAVPAVEHLVFPGLPPVPFLGLRDAGLLERLPIAAPWYRLTRAPSPREAALAQVPQAWFDAQPL